MQKVFHSFQQGHSTELENQFLTALLPPGVYQGLSLTLSATTMTFTINPGSWVSEPIRDPFKPDVITLGSLVVVEDEIVFKDPVTNPETPFDLFGAETGAIRIDALVGRVRYADPEGIPSKPTPPATYRVVAGTPNLPVFVPINPPDLDNLQGDTILAWILVPDGVIAAANCRIIRIDRFRSGISDTTDGNVDIRIRASNTSGVDIAAGKLVYIDSVNTSVSPPMFTFKLADSGDAKFAEWVTATEVKKYASGVLVKSFALDGLNTDPVGGGAPIYLGEDGGITVTKPVNDQIVGKVTVADVTLGRAIIDLTSNRVIKVENAIFSGFVIESGQGLRHFVNNLTNTVKFNTYAFKVSTDEGASPLLAPENDPDESGIGNYIQLEAPNSDGKTVAHVGIVVDNSDVAKPKIRFRVRNQGHFNQLDADTLDAQHGEGFVRHVTISGTGLVSTLPPPGGGPSGRTGDISLKVGHTPAGDIDADTVDGNHGGDLVGAVGGPQTGAFKVLTTAPGGPTPKTIAITLDMGHNNALDADTLDTHHANELFTGVSSGNDGITVNVTGGTGTTPKSASISNAGILTVTGTASQIGVTAGQNPVFSNLGILSLIAGAGISITGGQNATIAIANFDSSSDPNSGVTDIRKFSGAGDGTPIAVGTPGGNRARLKIGNFLLQYGSVNVFDIWNASGLNEEIHFRIGLLDSYGTSGLLCVLAGADIGIATNRDADSFLQTAQDAQDSFRVFIDRTAAGGQENRIKVVFWLTLGIPD